MRESDTTPAVADGEKEITLGLLNAVHENSAMTQRSAAGQLGIALGLANAYLKRCMKKGLIKVQQIPPNRYAYYLTPQGFAEKSRLTAEYLTSSFTFFRRARTQGEEALAACAARGWRRVALVGVSELAEILTLCAGEVDVELVGIVDRASDKSRFAGIRVVGEIGELGPVDAAIVTHLNDSQGEYERLGRLMQSERIVILPLLGISADGAAPKGAKPKRAREDAS